MKKATKDKQIVVRFDKNSYEKISDYAHKEHRGLGEFIRHAALVYIEAYDRDGDKTLISRLMSGREDSRYDMERQVETI